MESQQVRKYGIGDGTLESGGRNRVVNAAEDGTLAIQPDGQAAQMSRKAAKRLCVGCGRPLVFEYQILGFENLMRHRSTSRANLRGPQGDR